MTLDLFNILLIGLAAVAGGAVNAIAGSHSLRELWHLRAGVYNTVGRQHSEAEAERRIERLNQHFPTRAARPGLPGMSTS